MPDEVSNGQKRRPKAREHRAVDLVIADKGASGSHKPFVLITLRPFDKLMVRVNGISDHGDSLMELY